MLKYKTNKLTNKPCRSCIWPVMILPDLCMWICLSTGKMKQTWFSEPSKLLNCDYWVQSCFIHVSLYFFAMHFIIVWEFYVVHQDGTCNWIIITLINWSLFGSQDLYSTVLMVCSRCAHSIVWLITIYVSVHACRCYHQWWRSIKVSWASMMSHFWRLLTSKLCCSFFLR